MKKYSILTGVMLAALSGAYMVYSLSQATATTTVISQKADAQTIKAVGAAEAFLETLTAPQKKAVMFAFTDAAQRVRWSNFPQGAFNRVGVGWSEMNTTQRTALVNLLGTILSADGLRMAREQMDADDVVKASESGGGSVKFGSDYYYVSFLGTPSATSPWMLQFGGHHLGINATVVGPNITLAPSHTGGQPLKYTKDGKAINIVEQEVKESIAMLESLDAAQRSKVVISSQITNLVLGPGQDGKTLQPEGLPGSAMSAAQKTKFLALIKARLSALNADDLAVKMTEVQKNLEKTYFAWYGPTNPGGAAYYRVTGPTVLIEYAPQTDRGGGGDVTNHAHSMYRDPTNDYGAAWTKLK
jgi:Protein of unknown function (DUF3500)